MASLHVVISENMAAVVRLLPSIRTQMASLTWPLLIFQDALCSHHLETGIRNKLLRTKGPFCIKRRVGRVKVSQVSVRGECVLPAHFRLSIKHPPLVFPRPHRCHALPSRPPYISTCLRFLQPPPPLPPLPHAEARVKFITTVKVRDDR